MGGVRMSERYKREIEEILQQAGELSSGGHPRGSRPRLLRLVWLSLVQSLGGRIWPPTAARVMLLGGALLLTGFVVQVPLLPWAGLALLLVGYAMVIMRPPRIEKRWRGQRIDYEETWWDRVRRRNR